MTSTRQLKRAIIGLIAFAATEEQVLLAGSPAEETGSPQNWAALPVVAHNTEFKAQQVERLLAIRQSRVPQDFTEVSHSSSEVYLGYAVQPSDRVAAESNRVTGDLIEGLKSAGAEDLLDPSRNPWLKGRQLWLQVIVRGFWHPTGHLADYYLAHGQADRAVGMAAHALATARYFGVPDEACGMASFNLACAQAKAGCLEDAAATVRETIGLNPGLRAKMGTEPDLAALRDGGYLESAGAS
jgi:hypothetical protein